MNNPAVSTHSASGWSSQQSAATLQTLLLGAVLSLILFTVDINVTGGGGTDIALNPQVLIKVGLWTVAGILAFIHLRQVFPTFAYIGPLLLAMMLGVAVLSTSYSLTPDLTLGSCYGVICTAMFTALTMRAFPERAFSMLLLGTTIALIVACWAAHFTTSGFTGQEQYTNAAGEVSLRVGGLMHPNGLGRNAAMALGIAVIMFRQRELGGPALIIVVAICVVTIVASQSRTAAIGLVTALTAVYLRKISLSALLMVVAVGVVGVIGAATLLLNNPDFAADTLGKFARTGDVEEIYSLTGRVLVWSISWEHIQASPILGYGFGAARAVFATAELGPSQWVAPNTHNALLEILISLGFVGGVLFVAMLMRQLYLFARQPREIADFILIYIVVTGVLTAGPFIGVPNGLYMIFIASLFWRPIFGNRPTQSARG